MTNQPPDQHQPPRAATYEPLDPDRPEQPRARAEQAGVAATPRAKRILCVWLPNWPIQRIQAVEPQLATHPLGLYVRDSRRGMIITAANLLARAAGVRPHMRLAEASGLIELEARPHQQDEDIESLCSLAEQAQRFSPLVGLEQLDRKVWAGRPLHQPESLLLDVTGLAQLFNGHENLMMQLSGWLHQQRYFGCIAIAGSVGAAWAIANYALRSPTFEKDRYQATACQSQENGSNGAFTKKAPDGTHEDSTQDPTDHGPPRPRCLHVEFQEQPTLLEQLPLTALRIDEPTHATLRRLGLRTIGQLKQLPRSGLASRIDKQVLVRLNQIEGQCDEPIIALHAQPDWCIEHELEYPTDHIQTIVELVKRGMVRLAGGLEKRGEGALRVVCRLDLVEHIPLILQLGLYRPTSDPDHLNLLASCLLEQQLPRQMKASLWRLTVQATLTAPLVWRQGDLFHASEAANRQQMAGLVDMLSARLGRKQVLRASATGEAQPELAYELKPLTGLRSDGSTQDTVRKIASRRPTSTVQPAREDPLRRPARLLQSPTPIQVAGTFGIQRPDPVDDEIPQSKEKSDNLIQADNQVAAAPARIKTANGWHQVLGAVGPERLESGWWKGQSKRRDYYRVITHLGCWWWIFRDLNTAQWYLHGMFD